MASSSKGGGHAEEKIRNGEELSKAAALRELEKARVRECQMEKTVRWWTVCTAGWRKKWSKLRQENEDLRKQIKAYKTQVTGMTQDLNSSNSKLEYYEVRYNYLKSEMTKILTKYGEEGDDRIQEILNAPDIIKPKIFTCSECQNKKNESKIDIKPADTPDAENLFPEIEDKYSINEDSNYETKNVEILTEMITKIFSDLQHLKGEFVKSTEESGKDIPEIAMNTVQISQLKLCTMIKHLEKERVDKKELKKKLEQANNEITMLHNKIEEMATDEYLLDPDCKLELQKLSLSDDE